jgi:2-hydroxy-6-oxonona-2,4-dienedioate hydrolase
MINRRALLAVGVAGAGLAAASLVARSYVAAARQAEDRVSAGSTTVTTSFGSVEYADRGSGLPVLMVHGTGGGFDQGLSFAAPLLKRGRRIIAPSRFGYLGSSFPADPSSQNQADAFVELLDHLGIERLPALGGSAGALSAIEFAIRHPSRCSGLIALVPASYVPGRPRTPGPTGLQEAAMKALLGSDLLFWLALQTMPSRMIGTLLATDPLLLDTASKDERTRVHAILRNILPVSRRSLGLLNDARLASNPEAMAFDRIEAPTLAVSLEDDRFGTAAAARHLAATVPGAKLVIYPTGGHVWVGHDTEIMQQVDDFIAAL